MKGLIGKKVGMTQVFDPAGRRVAVTVIEAGPCVVVRRKTKAEDGYDAAQLAFGTQKEQRLTKPMLGVFRKAGVPAGAVLREVGLEDGDEAKAGDAVTVSIFEKVGYVDVTATSKGKGFAGVVRKHHMAGGPMTHGGHTKRRIGAVGQRSFPGRIQKNKRMPAHMGHETVTQQNLRVIQVRGEDNALLVEGAVPGPVGGWVLVRKALKKKGAKS
jgi:large subunit ribosomal protein L3